MIRPPWTRHANGPLARLVGNEPARICRPAHDHRRHCPLINRRSSSSSSSSSSAATAAALSSPVSGRVHGNGKTRTTTRLTDEEAGRTSPDHQTASPAPSDGPNDPDGGAPIWPLLKRKKGPLVGRYRFSSRPVPRHTAHAHAHVHAQAGPPSSLQHSSNANRLMLIIDGLSPAMRPSDFYRLGPSALSAWGAAIKKVQQRRDPRTLEPSGQYWVTFDSAAAAVAFRAKLVRLHALGGLKLRSATGLWESSVPPELHAGLAGDFAPLPPPSALTPPTPSTSSSSSSTSPSSSRAEPGLQQQQQQNEHGSALKVKAKTPPHAEDGAAALNRLVASFTLAPASLSPIHLQRRRVAIARPWARRLAELVRPHGFGDRPPVILVDVYPPTMAPSELHDFIRADGDARGLRWQVTKPQLLGAQPGWGVSQGRDRGQRSSTDQDRGSDEPEQDSDAGQEQEVEDPAHAKARRAAPRLGDRAAEELLRGRFFLVAPNETEAQRFHRGWNGRSLTVAHRRDGRFTARTSIVDW